MAAAETFTHAVEALAEHTRNSEAIQTRLVHNNIFFVTKQQRSEGESLYFSAKSVKNAVFLVETSVSAGVSRVAVSMKTSDPQLAQHFIQALSFLLSTSY